MKSRDAKLRFLSHLDAAGVAMADLTMTSGIHAMLDFYTSVRADGCSFENDGDMLLFEWGPNDWGIEPTFDVSITRQFLREDDEIDQLTLSFRFDPAHAPVGDSAGNRWCHSLEQAEDFRRFVTESTALLATTELTPVSVELRYGRT